MRNLSFCNVASALLIVLTTATNSPCSADIEMISGDQKMLVDNAGRVTSSLPEVITPDGFSAVIQPALAVPSRQVSELFRSMRNAKARETNPQSPEKLSQKLSIPLEDSFKRPQVTSYLNQLLDPNNNRSKLAKERLGYYRPLFERVFEEEGVPNELIAVGFVESTYNIAAKSPAGACGIWQFIPSTGKIYGLESQEDFVDPVKSSRAAAKYLKRLHNRFGDWLLALAAYNGGETRVQQAINKTNGSKNFWEIAKHLPSETRNYVPRVIASCILIASFEE